MGEMRSLFSVSYGIERRLFIMVYIKGSGKQPIEMVRGNSEVFQVSISINKNPYTPQEGDKVRFAMRSWSMSPFAHLIAPLIWKDIPISTMQLVIDPEDTKHLPTGKYVYDMKITFADGRVKTFVKPSPFFIREGVD